MVSAHFRIAVNRISVSFRVVFLQDSDDIRQNWSSQRTRLPGRRDR